MSAHIGNQEELRTLKILLRWAYLDISVVLEVTGCTCDDVERLLAPGEGHVIGDEGHVVLCFHAGVA